MGGEMNFTSKGKGWGSTFTVSVPMTTSDLNEKRALNIRKTSYHKVMVASDDLTYFSLKSQIKTKTTNLSSTEALMRFEL